MKKTKHDLSDYSIYECVLEAAKPKIEVLARVELPFLSAWVAGLAGVEDEDESNQVIRISFEDEHLEQVFRGEFQISENVLKGIAESRDADLAAFAKAFLPIYRPSYLQAVLRHEFHVLEIEGGADQTLISKWDAYTIFLGFDTAPWTIADVNVQAVNSELFRVEVTFRNEDFEQNMRKQAAAGQAVDYDNLILPISLTWDEFLTATETTENLIDLLERIHRDFLVRKDDLKGGHSNEAERLLAYFDALADGDGGRLAEDPFTTGELDFDEDGRVHFSSDLK